MVDMAATGTEVLVEATVATAMEDTAGGTGMMDILTLPPQYLFRPLSLFLFQCLYPFVFPFAEPERWAAARWAEVDTTSTATVMVTARRRFRPERRVFNTKPSVTKEARWDQETEDADKSVLSTTCRLRHPFRLQLRLFLLTVTQQQGTAMEV